MAETPMMRQYLDAKAACPDALLFFRMGDFYELFQEDARTAAKLLGLALTSRDKTENAVPMAGFPHHQLESYLAKLVSQGIRVAICEQVEDPKQAKGLVKREVTRVVTPGTLTDDALLDPRECNYLAAVVCESPGKASTKPFSLPGRGQGEGWGAQSHNGHSSERTSGTVERNASSSQIPLPSPQPSPLKGEGATVAESELVGVAWVELSVGRFQAAVVPRNKLTDLLASIGPAECLLDEETALPLADVCEGKHGGGSGKTLLTRRPAWMFSRNTALATLSKHFGAATLEGFGFEPERDALALRAAGAILDYLAETQRASLAHLDKLAPYRIGNALEIDEATRRSLEISRTMREGRREGSLLAVLDRTVTAMGSRLLADWVASPLAELTAIEQRQDAVAELVADGRLTDDLREKLRGIYDIQRLLARVTTGRASPRDLAHIGSTLATLPAVKAKLTGRGLTSSPSQGEGRVRVKAPRTNADSSQRAPSADKSSTVAENVHPHPNPLPSREREPDNIPLIQQIELQIDLCPEIRAKLETALVENCPLQSRDGGIIRGGFHAELDQLRELATGGKQWIANYQSQEAARTGINTLKVGFNKVFGYYIEITHTHGDKIPASYIRKQTVKNAERYITPELKEYEEKVLTADERAKNLEYELFLQLRNVVANCVGRLQATAAALAQLDALASLADLARARNYCRPKLVDSAELSIIDGRHPVLDSLLAGGAFVPNDTLASPDDGLILLITGPNMAGKSTYIRQVALLTLMAQIGSFVPAREATLGLADRIFARVGASDELSRGQSTFMVEMVETARILNTATPRSLVILDEIGRGTSTYDGVSLAWAVVEYLHDHIGCRTLFATHYHELTDLAKTLSSVRNLNVAVREWEDQVVFLHKIVEGAADKSYGIHVARLAGVPREVNQRAKQILAQLEQEHLDDDGRPKMSRRGKSRRVGDLQLTLFAAEPHPIVEKLRTLDLNALSPLAAMQMLHEWQSELAGSQLKAKSN